MIACDINAYDKIKAAVKNAPQAVNFIQEFEDSLPEAATPKAGYIPAFIQKGLKKLGDLVATPQKPGIYSIPAELFTPNRSPALTRALTQLGLDAKTAATVVKGYHAYKARFDALVTEDKMNNGAIALRKPLSMLSVEKNKTDLPPQVIFAMMLGSTNWLAENQGTEALSVRQQAEFLTGDQRQDLSTENFNVMSQLGRSYQETVASIGQDIVHMLQLSPRSLDTAEFYENLTTALGIMGLEVLNKQAKEAGPELVILSHTWDLFNAGDKNRLLSIVKASDPGSAATIESLGEAANKAEQALKGFSIRQGSKLVGSSAHIAAVAAHSKAVTAYTAAINRVAAASKSNALRKAINEISEGYAFTQGNTYLHVVTNPELPAILPDKQKKKIKAQWMPFQVAAGIIGTDPTRNPAVPSKTPTNKVVSAIRNSFGGVPKRMEKIVRELQNTKWEKTDVAPVVSRLYEKHAQLLYDLGGVVVEHDNDPELLQVSIKAANANKRKAIDDFVEADQDQAFDEGVYFTYRLMNQHRMMQVGNINPQNSHITRWLLRAHKPVTYTKENIHQFHTALLMNLGYDVDKKTPAELNQAAEEVLRKQELWQAAALISDESKTDQFAKAVQKAYTAVEFKPGDDAMSLLSALQALNAYAPMFNGEAKSFKSDIAMEIDGITNGFAINLLQFPNSDMELVERRLNQTGTYLGKAAEYLQHLTSGIYAPAKQAIQKAQDVYTELGERVFGEYSTAETAADYYSTKGEDVDVEMLQQQLTALNKLFPDLQNPLKYRKLVKNPFMVFQYGGGISSISRSMASGIFKDVLTQIGAMQREYRNLTADQQAEYIKEHVLPMQENLATLGIKMSLAKLVRSKGDELVKADYFEGIFINNAAYLLAPRLDLGLNSMLGGSTEQRQAVIRAVQGIYAIFRVKLDEAIQTELAKTGRNQLSNRELLALVKSEEYGLLNYLPQYRGPLMNADDISFVDLTQRSRTINNDKTGTVEVAIAGPQKTRSASNPVKDIESGGVASMIRMIINMDAALAATTLEANPSMLMLYDAFMADPNSLDAASDLYGKNYLKFSKEKGIAAAVNDQFQRIVQSVDQNTIDRADKWLATQSFEALVGADEVDTIAGLQESLPRVSATVERNRKQMFDAMDDRGVHSNQLYLPDTSEFNPNADTPVDNRRADIELARDRRKKDVIKASDWFKGFSRKTQDLITRMLNNYGAARFLELYSQYTSERALGFVRMAVNNSDASESFVKLRAASQAILEGDNDGQTTVPRLMADFLNDGSTGNASLVLDLVEYLKLSPAELESFKQDIIRNLGRYAVKQEFTNNREISEIDAETEQQLKAEVEALLSLDDMPRENVTETHAGKITADTVKRLFDKFSSLSDAYYESTYEKDTHQNILSRVMNTLARGINETREVKLSVEQIDGVTQGGYSKAQDRVRVSMSRQAPPSYNGQSPQEVYVHELLHAITTRTLNSSPLIARKVRGLYAQTRKAVDEAGGYRVFLTGVTNPGPADIDMAKAQYNYLFGEGAASNAKLDEFLAYAVTNKQMVTFLANQQTSLIKQSGNLLDQIMHYVDVVVDWFNRALRGGLNTNSYEDMIAVVEEIVRIQNKHESHFAWLSKMIHKGATTADKLIQKWVGERLPKAISSNPASRVRKVVNAAIGGAVYQLSDKAGQHAVSQVAYKVLNRTLYLTYQDMGPGALTQQLIQRLLNARNIISKGRQNMMRANITHFNTNMFKSTTGDKIGVATKNALTRVMLRADLSALLGISMSFDQVAKLLDNKDLVKQEIRNIQTKLSAIGIGPNHRAISYARELGIHTIARTTNLSNAHMNAFSIARLEVANSEIEVEATALLDAYASLVGLEYLHANYSEDIALVNTLAKEEFTADPADNGITDILIRHSSFKQISLEDLFRGNPMQMEKGWTSEQVDSLHDIKTGTEADIKRMRHAGYTRYYELGQIPGVPQGDTLLFVSKNAPEQRFVSGMMSVTNYRNMGTTLSSILAKNPRFHTQDKLPDHKKISRMMRRIARAEFNKAKNLNNPEPTKLRPIRNEQGEITDYRVIMDTVNREELLNPDRQFQNVFARMYSNQLDKIQTVINDIQTVDALIYEQVNLMPFMPDRFINILDKENPHYESYLRLPYEVRQYMHQYAVDGKFMVRDSIVEKVFGYPALDIRQLKWLQGENKVVLKAWAAFVHYLVKEIVSFGVDRIVIGTTAVVANNLISNVYNLAMHKINPVFTLSKMYEGLSEYRRYKKDTEELRQLNLKLQSYGLDPQTSPEGKRRQELLADIQGNSLHRMSEAGLNSLIVEDLNEASDRGYITRMQRYIDESNWGKYLDRVPTSISTIAHTLFLTKKSLPYRAQREIVQLTDFLARYVMIEHATKVNGEPFNKAMFEAVENFVLFDENVAPPIEALNAVGGTLFTSYYMRNTRAVRKLIQKHPISVMTAAGVEQVTDLDALANVSSSLYAGNLFPSYLQLDDIVTDKIITVPFIDNYWIGN